MMLCAFAMVAVAQSAPSLYDFKVQDIDGKAFDMASLKGKKVLVVNVASKCGFTPQYKDLEALYEKYKDRNFVIVGFPANNFMKQEPGTDAEIKQFCTLNYGVSFPMMSKIDVTGKKKAPIYKWLTEKKVNGKMNAEVQWNFQKFMINEKGELVGFVPPKDKPFCDTIVNWIEEK